MATAELAADLGNHTKSAAVVAAFGNFQVCQMTSGEQPPYWLVIVIKTAADQFDAAACLDIGYHVVDLIQFVCTKERIYLRQFVEKLICVALYQAPTDD